MSNNIFNPNETDKRQNNNTFYKNVMLWLAASLAIAAASTFILGPMIPAAMIMPISIVLVVGLLIASFTKAISKFSTTFLIAIPAALGAILYPTLNAYVASGMGGVIVQALLGTVIVFGTAAILGWKSDKNMQKWYGPLLAITLGVIGVSLMNILFFKLTMLSMLISIAVLVIFSIYSFIDVQAVRKKAYGNQKPQFYALRIFLDIFNIFTALLNLLR